MSQSTKKNSQVIEEKHLNQLSQVLITKFNVNDIVFVISNSTCSLLILDNT